MFLSKLALSIVHTILVIYGYICNTWHDLKKPWSFMSLKVTPASIKQDSKSLRKLPIHIGILLVEEELSYTDLAKIALWCVALGISYISFYDRLGACKVNKQIFKEEFYKEKKKFHIDNRMDKYDIHMHAGIEKLQSSSNQGNSKHRVEIRFLSVEDGRQHILQATRLLCRAVKLKSMKSSDINPTTVDHILQGSTGLPDPDLVLKFGETESLLGFPPWQIRLTEFLSCRTHHHIDYKSFHRLLDSYGNVNQRFGK